MGRGADGAMTGCAYPEMMVGVVNAYKAGQRDRARDIFDAYLPLARYEQQPGPGLAVRKYVLQKRGAIASAALRNPAPKLPAADLDAVARMLTRPELRPTAIVRAPLLEKVSQYINNLVATLTH